MVNTKIDFWTLQEMNKMRYLCECDIYLNKDIKWIWAILIYNELVTPTYTLEDQWNICWIYS